MCANFSDKIPQKCCMICITIALFISNNIFLYCEGVEKYACLFPLLPGDLAVFIVSGRGHEAMVLVESWPASYLTSLRVILF